MATRFNGYGAYELIEVADQPFASAYGAASPTATAAVQTLFNP